MSKNCPFLLFFGHFPIFSKDREYIEKLLKIEDEKGK